MAIIPNHPELAQIGPEIMEPIAPPIKLPTTIAVFNRLLSEAGRVNNLVCPNTKVVCVAISKMIMTRIIAIIELLKTAPIITDKAMHIIEIPVTGIDKPRS